MEYLDTLDFLYPYYIMARSRNARTRSKRERSRKNSGKRRRSKRSRKKRGGFAPLDNMSTGAMTGKFFEMVAKHEAKGAKSIAQGFGA